MLGYLLIALVASASATVEPLLYSLIQSQLGLGEPTPLSTTIQTRFYLEGVENLKLRVCSSCPAGVRVISDCTTVSDTVCDAVNCLGVETNPPESARRYSSVNGNNAPGTGCNQGRLDSPLAWCAGPSNNVPNEFLQLDLGSPQLVVSTIVQPRSDGGTGSQRVMRYKVQYSNTDSDVASSWTFVDGGFEFDGPQNGFEPNIKVRGAFKTPVSARYWRLIPTLVNGHMSMRWGVAVGAVNCNPPTTSDVCNVNFAVSRPAIQTSIGWDGQPTRAVAPGDGRTDWGSGTCTHTDAQLNGFWRVEFDGPKAINTVQILNRSDCCRERLSSVEIRIGDDVNNVFNNELCNAVSDERARTGDFLINLTCQRLIRGRYMFIVQRRQDYLTLCNVKAFRKC